MIFVVTEEEKSMNDLISRQALCEYALNQKDKSVTPNDIMRFPSAQPILNGYNIEHPVLIEKLLEKENPSSERVSDTLCDIDQIVHIAVKQFKETLRRKAENE